jgi:hypothetical protein
MAVFYRETEASLRADTTNAIPGWKESLETEAQDFLAWFEEQKPGYAPSASETAARRLAQAVMANVEGYSPGDAPVTRVLGGLALARGDDLLQAVVWDGLPAPTAQEWLTQVEQESKEVA